LTCLVNRFMALQPGGYTDRPQDDNTRNSHPAFKRGKVRGILETLAILRNIINGVDNGSGSINSPEIEKIRRAVFIMKEALSTAPSEKDGSKSPLSKPHKAALDEAKKIADTLTFQ
jgi:hypothetical protein